MFDTIFEMLYALFLLIVISVGNNIFINRNNNNHVILVEEEVVENEQRTVVNNNDNNNIIYNILNPNDDDTDIQITGNAIISLVTDDSQMFSPAFSLLRNNDQLVDNNPIYRISYSERTDSNNRNMIGFIARDNLYINFQNPENSILLEIGTNIIEANKLISILY